MKKVTCWLAASIFLMIVMPWIAVTFVQGDGGMAMCLILFFAVNPVFSVFMGLDSGKNLKAQWCLPIVSAVLFLVGTWIFFDMGETAFITYAFMYLGLGAVAMVLSATVWSRSRR